MVRALPGGRRGGGAPRGARDGRFGLADFGYGYVNIDDGWEAETRAADGEIVANAKFPDMRGLTDEIHAMGLRAGLYSSPGPKTCGQYLGSWRHEGQDARTWARWGFDLIKYDWCSYGEIAPNPDLPAMQKPYRLITGEIAKTNRDIALSLCQYGMGDVRAWAPRSAEACGAPRATSPTSGARSRRTGSRTAARAANAATTPTC